MSEPDQNVTANHPVVRVTDRRRVFRPLALATPFALLLLVAACGSDTTTPTATAPSPTVTASSSPTATSDSSSGGAVAGSELTGVVGAEGDADAFKITLMDSAGAPVTTLKAGDYTVKVKDLSKIHNFNLSGAGVAETTTVSDVTEVTWKVTFKAGTYTYKCDPHPNMVGTFTVT